MRGTAPDGTPDAPPCKFWSEGKCTKKNNCSRYHIPYCRYEKEGRCNKGKYCNFLHYETQATPAPEPKAKAKGKAKSKAKAKAKKKAAAAEYNDDYEGETAEDDDYQEEEEQYVLQLAVTPEAMQVTKERLQHHQQVEEERSPLNQ
jgi:hypothetical protein